jgi:U3 small nucleolar RNA-associated protein 12
MGLTKQYLRYAPKDILGIIAGSRCNIQSIKYRGFDGKHVAVGACQFVFIWDLKKAEAVRFYTNKYC